MPYLRSALAILLCSLLTAPVYGQTPELSGMNHGSLLNWFTNNYTPHPLPPVSYEDSPRIDKLMRAGIIYLSLRDAIALALENNLDLEVARYNPKLAEANLMRASAGALLRNVSNSISNGPSSAQLGVLASNALGSGGTGGERRERAGRRAQRPQRAVGRLGHPEPRSYVLPERLVPYTRPPSSRPPTSPAPTSW